MAYELPTELIKEIQILARAQAGLSGYDPGRASEFPGISSLSEYVSGFDPSPPDHRCKHCKGSLLRGLESLLCIYCGRLNDVAFPDPISFKDTLGYSWLLRSLHLDGSEKVEQPTEEKKPKRGHSNPVDKISLSDLLNLKISWPTEPEKPGMDVKHKMVEESNGSLRLAGIELDDFFLDLKREKGSTIFEQPIVSNQAKTQDSKPVAAHDNLSFFQHVQPSGPVTAHDNLSFFEHVQPSGSALSSNKEKDNESSGWQADFQSADTETQHGTSQSLGVDLSARMDSVFGTGKDLKDKSLEASSVSVNQTTDDFWSNGSEVFQQAGNFNSTASAQDTQKQDNFSNPSSTVDFSAQIDSVFGSGIELKDENSASSSVPITGTSDDLWNNGSQVFQKTGVFDSAISAKDTHSQDNFNNPSTSTDWFQGDEWKTNNSNSPKIGITNKNDDFDEWKDFTGSSSIQGAPTSARTGGDVQPVASNEKPSELSLFGLDNKLDKMDFNSYPEPDPFSDLSSKKEATVEANSSLPEGPASDRRADAISMPDDTAGQDLLNVDILDSSTQPKDNVQTLISQMHDLSFMLKDELSVPSKSDKS